MAKHRPARNRFRWIPALTLTGLVLIGGVSVSAYSNNTPSHVLSAPVSVSHSVPFPKPLPKVSVPQKAAQAPVARYTVRNGDTLWSVAKAHCGTGTDDTALAKANHIANANAVSPGEVIILNC